MMSCTKCKRHMPVLESSVELGWGWISAVTNRVMDSISSQHACDLYLWAKICVWSAAILIREISECQAKWNFSHSFMTGSMPAT